jgi:hypothetical protein
MWQLIFKRYLEPILEKKLSLKKCKLVLNNLMVRYFTLIYTNKLIQHTVKEFKTNLDFFKT